jgi:surfeit locus 1 family protein
VNSSANNPFKLEFNWKISLFTVVLLPVMVGLGFWQLQRADEKSTIQQSLEQQQALPPIDLMQADATENATFRRVSFSGRPDSQHIWLVENQVYQGKVGFHLLVPVVLEDGRNILVNAGWVPGGIRRGEIPPLPQLPESGVFSGQLRTVSQNHFLRGELVDAGWPKRILQVDIPVMEKSLVKSLLPWVVQLDAASPMAQTVYWPAINMSADKHIAYAVQWFLMAFVLTILWLYANSNLGRRRKSDNKVTSGE